MVRKWRQNDYFFGNISSLGEVFGILQILVRSMRAPINKWGVFGIFTLFNIRALRGKKSSSPPPSSPPLGIMQKKNIWVGKRSEFSDPFFGKNSDFGSCCRPCLHRKKIWVARQKHRTQEIGPTKVKGYFQFWYWSTYDVFFAFKNRESAKNI